jgi:hypothetical protein
MRLRFCLLAVLVLGGCGAAKDAEIVVPVASLFRVKLFSENLDHLYFTTSYYFRSAVTENDFKEFGQAIRDKLGDEKSTKLEKVYCQYSNRDPVCTLSFSSVFARGTASETMTMLVKRIDNKKTAEVVGYSINDIVLKTNAPLQDLRI